MKFQDILSQYNIPFAEGGQHRSVRQGFIGFDCPFCCRSKGEYYAAYNISKGYVSCWRCGYQHIAKVLRALTGEPLAKFHGLWKDLDLEKQQARKQGALKIPSGVDRLKAVHIRYLHDRGFRNLDVLENLWRIQGTEMTSNLPWRIWIPIHLHGQIVSWTTRAIGDAQLPRYKSASPEEESVHHKTLLYGADHVRHSAIVVEGPLDAWAIGPGAVATLGVGFTTAQLSKIAEFPMRSICFDSEPVAQERARQLADALSIFPGTTQVVQLSQNDPASASKREIEQLRRTCLS